MSTIRIYIFSLLLLGLTFAVSCNKEPTPPTDLHPVSLTYPKYIPPPNLSADNPLTEEGIALGRKLYYDPILSNNGKSCSSCHPQQSGFTDSIFNALPHVNLAWNKYFLWNGKVKGSLEDIMDFEVREFFSTDVSKLNADPIYPDLFRKVFNAKTIKEEHIIKALSQFMATQVSMDSKVDKYLKKEWMLNDDELRGLYIFNSEKGDCFHCHSLGLFTDGQFHNIGIDSVFTGVNLGRYNVTGEEGDIGKFKTPSLKNIALTGPYMHDGRFKTLEEVIEFYNSQVRKSPSLDPIMSKPSFKYGLQLTQQDKNDLLAFLKALTDSAFIHNPALAAP